MMLTARSVKFGRPTLAACVAVPELHSGVLWWFLLGGVQQGFWVAAADSVDLDARPIAVLSRVGFLVAR